MNFLREDLATADQNVSAIQAAYFQREYIFTYFTRSTCRKHTKSFGNYSKKKQLNRALVQRWKLTVIKETDLRIVKENI